MIGRQERQQPAGHGGEGQRHGEGDGGEGKRGKIGLDQGLGQECGEEHPIAQMLDAAPHVLRNDIAPAQDEAEADQQEDRQQAFDGGYHSSDRFAAYPRGV